MLIIYTALLIVASVVLLSIKRTKEFAILLGICVSLMLEFSGILIYVAKMGGYPRQTLLFLFLTMEIKTKIQYMLITFGQMGYLFAMGRYLFPMFLLLLASEYTMLPIIRKNRWWKLFITVIPAVTLILSYPSVYRAMFAKYPSFDAVLFYFTRVWIILYMLLALLLLLIEVKSITMRYYKGRFSLFTLGMFAVTVLYFMYCMQDPGQIYCMYNSEYSYSLRGGLNYLKYGASSYRFGMVVTLSIVCCALGFYGVMRYARGIYLENAEEEAISGTFDTAQVGASMFVHSMKNQFLSNQILLRRAEALCEKEPIDIKEMCTLVSALEETNHMLLKRVEELYRFINTNRIYLVCVDIKEVVEETLERFERKYPEQKVQVDMGSVGKLLVDKDCFCEALYNLLINGAEAVMEAREADSGRKGKLCLRFHNERLYTVIEVTDNGIGMNRKQMKNIFKPFYSSKNSNYNWGMGLFYVRKVVKGHMGGIRGESVLGQGSRFIITLPKYDSR